ncbi:helix-turn-helix transcriptional regulator [Saccharopolyspora rosea]|uniref:LuxR C-terminal-related transcriptional regulator n=1 Tax=Saccharopolyspora rosea TaxID=524884 RepID=A0ABW3G1D8_9PSEU|nr:LuxR family transcriptional regulator [Saccharopolyspora rosea]
MARQAEPVGRRAELAWLAEVLAVVRGGRSRCAVVAGPAGIGKTAVVEHFLARHGDVHLARATGMRWEQQVPFGVVDQLLGERCSTPLRAAERLVAAWSTVDRTAVVVVEDAQWADPDSLRALVSAHRRAGNVLVLLLVRDDRRCSAEVRDVVSGLPAVRVAPLAARDVRTLAVRHAGRDLAAPAALRLAEHTGGNPRHVRDLLDELPPESWSRWQPVLPAPRAVAEDVARTLADCRPDTRALVESAAVLGASVAVGDAAELSDVDDPVVALDEAVTRGLVDTVPGHGLLTMSFVDPLVRAAVHHALPPLRRDRLHRAAAEAVEDEGARLLHLVAVAPSSDAGLADRLDDYASGQAALGAWSAAAQALVHASRLSPRRPERERRLVRAVDALVGAGDLAQAAAFSPQVESFPPGPLRDAVLGYLAILRGRPAEAELLLTSAWDACDPGRDTEVAAMICQRRVLHSLSRWHGPDLVAWGRRAVALAEPDDPSAVESEAIMGLGLAATGRIRQARRTCQEVVAKVSRGAQSQRVQLGKGWLDLALDDPRTARRELEIAVPTEYRMGSVRISLWAQAWLARTEFALGAWDDAVRTVEHASVVVDQTGLELVRPLVHWTGAQIHALRGDVETAEAHLRQISASEQHYEVMLIPACLARAQCAEARSDYDGVLRALEPLVRLWPRQGVDEPGFWPWPDVYANALVMTDRAAEADVFLRPHEEVAADRDHRSSLARLGYARGRVHAALGDLDAARAAFDGALDRLKSLPLPYERARVHFAYGQTLRRAGKRREADVVVRRARDGYAALGATTYVERCDRELKAGGLHPRRGVDVAELTPQEQSVARLVARGMTNKQVAVELFLSVKTVQFHLTRIYAKLGIHSRGELAAHYREP